MPALAFPPLEINTTVHLSHQESNLREQTDEKKRRESGRPKLVCQCAGVKKRAGKVIFKHGVSGMATPVWLLFES